MRSSHCELCPNGRCPVNSARNDDKTTYQTRLKANGVLPTEHRRPIGIRSNVKLTLLIEPMERANAVEDNSILLGLWMARPFKFDGISRAPLLIDQPHPVTMLLGQKLVGY